VRLGVRALLSDIEQRDLSPLNEMLPDLARRKGAGHVSREIAKAS